jgi:predicted dehydrogenase
MECFVTTPKEDETLEEKIKVAVIGAGAIARTVHVPNYLSNEHVSVIAIVDNDYRRAERVARKFHIKKAYSSCEELFDKEEIDAISICTPPDTHEEIALNAFDHGSHVLCEKPLATNVESGKKMVEASKSKERILMVGFHRRFSPNYQMAKKYILEGRLGHVYCVEDHFVEPNPLFGWAKSPWYIEPGIGGVVNDLAPHVFDMLNFIFADFPEAVSACGSVHLDSPVEECATFLAEYPSGRLGVGVISWLSPNVLENSNIYGTAQNLFVSPRFFLKASPSDVFEISLLRAATESLVSMKFPSLSLIHTRRANPYQLEINHFVDQIRKGQQSNASALNALSVLMACDATKRALETKEKMKIPSP